MRFLGHAPWSSSRGDTNVLVDPFLTGNPKAAVAADELEPTHILLTHGHQDHFGDMVDIAKRTGATVVALTEIADELGGEGLENVRDPNLGGTVTFDWGWVKVVPAWHTSTTPKGTVRMPAGLLIKFGGTLVYHLGDTALFSDMQLISRRGDQVDVALVPIGGHYTMDRIDAVTAVEFIEPKTSSPSTTTRSRRSRPTPRRSRPTSSPRRARRSSSSRRARRTPSVTHAIVLIEAERSAMPTLGGASPTSRASPRPTRSRGSGTSWRSCACRAGGPRDAGCRFEEPPSPLRGAFGRQDRVGGLPRFEAVNRCVRGDANHPRGKPCNRRPGRLGGAPPQ